MRKKYDTSPGFPPGVLLDPDDFLIESVHHWLYINGYIARQAFTRKENGERKREAIYLHRAIAARMMGRPLARGRIVDQCDHKNANKLDNRKCNIRVVNKAINCQNRKGADPDSASGVRGVYWHRQRNKWHAVMRMGSHNFDLGFYDNLRDAASIAQEARERWMPGYLIDCYGNMN